MGSHIQLKTRKGAYWDLIKKQESEESPPNEEPATGTSKPYRFFKQGWLCCTTTEWRFILNELAHNC